MKKQTVLRVLSVLVVVFMSLAAASPAQAAEPVVNKYVFDSWYTKTDICPFTITVHETGLFMDKQWYDANGVLVREMYTYGGNIYYLYANEKTVTVQNSGTVKFTYISPYETRVTITGQEWVWNIPGLGMVSGEVGRQDLTYIYDASGALVDTVIRKLVGKVLWTDVTPLLCAYLAP